METLNNKDSFKELLLGHINKKEFHDINKYQKKFTTEIIYIDENTGELINNYEFKNYYYETKRQRTSEIANRETKIRIEITGKPNGQTKIEW
ncbi:MAG: hypothetical protein [Microviridae sp.]|nr:MAG: hypothetical protein [Microviridae sp.]